jgi:cell volume regulation protein A
VGGSATVAPRHEARAYATVVLLAAAAGLAAIVLTRITRRIPIPAPALFLLAAAIASDIFPGLRTAFSIQTVERIGVAALIVILFDGGLHLGWRRVRTAAVPILSLGVVGTFATAALIAAGAHFVLGFSWTTSGLLGAAVAPTDPAVMFSVLGQREPGGRAGIILKGESGANDPVGIALMIGMIEFARRPDASVATVIREFSLEMSIGVAIGLIAAVAGRRLLRTTLPSATLYPLRALVVAGIVYGVAGVVGGSGFLAVFILGLLLDRSTNRERIFIVWGGLRGAVPILLAALAVVEGVPDARTVYGIVFVVVAFSVLVQGSTVGAVAARLHLPLRAID